MSPALLCVRRPVLKTFAAIANEASLAGRFTVGKQIRSQSPEIASGPWPCLTSQASKVSSSRAGSSRSRRESARAALANRARALNGMTP